MLANLQIFVLNKIAKDLSQVTGFIEEIFAGLFLASKLRRTPT
ncbi:hypothetical protein [Neorhizobium tomejilense]|nr:hypothetical protein [Neorhizobium tomejilense]